jgi:hypothetical protein
MKSGPLSLTQQSGHAGGLGYLPAYQYVVALATDLSLIQDAVVGDSLANGTFAAVLIAGGQKQIWTLDTTSLAPVGPTVVYALSAGGNPANPGRWEMMTAQPNTSATDFFTDIIYRPAGVAVPGLVYTSWTGAGSVESVITADQGLVRIWLDPTGVVGPMTISPTAASTGKGMAELHSATGQQITLTLTPEFTLDSFGLFKDVVIESAVDFSAPGVHKFALTFGVQTIVRFDNAIVRPTGLATLGAMIGITAGAEGGTTHRHARRALRAPARHQPDVHDAMRAPRDARCGRRRHGHLPRCEHAAQRTSRRERRSLRGQRHGPRVRYAVRQGLERVL